MTTATYRMVLPWTRPPLSENDRYHWARKAELVKEIRTTVGWLTKAAQIPASAQCVVTLEWAPPADCRRRDNDNPTPTLKAICDGLVDAGVVPDDVPKSMRKEMPVILPGAGKRGRMWLVVTVEQDTEARA